MNKLENVIQKKLIGHGKRLENITIDFGKYPLVKTWTMKKSSLLQEPAKTTDIEHESLVQETNSRKKM